jgi:hypothetical protein
MKRAKRFIRKGNVLKVVESEERRVKFHRHEKENFFNQEICSYARLSWAR